MCDYFAKAVFVLIMGVVDQQSTLRGSMIDGQHIVSIVDPGGRLTNQHEEDWKSTFHSLHR